MKTVLRICALGLFLLLADPAQAIVGYINYNFHPGDNFFHNNLNNQGNLLSLIMNSETIPEGTAVSLWDPGVRAFTTTSVWDGVAWSSDFALPVGVGAKLTTATPFTHTFVGGVLNREGGFFDGFNFGTATAPPAGVYLLGDKAPVGGGNAFQRVIGRSPVVGEQIIYNDGTTLTFGENWVSDEDQLAVGQAALFNIGPVDFTYVVPEPSTAALGLVGISMLAIRRSARRILCP